MWPSNWPIVHIFIAMGTQWRVGNGGATGLDYNALPVVAKAHGIKLKRAVLDGIRVMENEALRVMAALRDKQGQG